MTNLKRIVFAGLLLGSLLWLPSAPVQASEEKIVNINAASATELAELKGIGNAKAQAIVDYREKNGPFKSVDDLKNVKGIGDGMLGKLRPQVSIGQTAAAAPAPAQAAHKP